jgi:hypothetical protein
VLNSVRQSRILLNCSAMNTSRMDPTCNECVRERLSNTRIVAVKTEDRQTYLVFQVVVAQPLLLWPPPQNRHSSNGTPLRNARIQARDCAARIDWSLLLLSSTLQPVRRSFPLHFCTEKTRARSLAENRDLFLPTFDSSVANGNSRQPLFSDCLINS